MNRNLNFRHEFVGVIGNSIIDHRDFFGEAGNLQIVAINKRRQLLILGRRIGMTSAELKGTLQ